jgi:predicted nucleic acid-binding protein
MTTAIDTNVIVALLDKSLSDNGQIEEALETAATISVLVIAAPVYAELLAFRGRNEAVLDLFLANTDIQVDWDIDEPAWRLAGLAHQAFAQRRRKQKADIPRRLLTDFIIGAHALANNYSLLTLDQRHYRAAFPKLKLQKI